MNLTTAQRKFLDVDEQTLEEVFADESLRGEFLILEANGDTFLQASGEGEGPYTLEYKEAGKQFQVMGELTKQEVREAFLDYLHGGSAWRMEHEWKELAPRKGCLKQAAVLLLLLGVVFWILIR
jgi:hypothetical protein